MEIFQIFKIIFGLIVSGVILFFLIQYSGTYTLLQKDILKTNIMKSFIDNARGVYLTGNPIKFTGFSRAQLSLSLDSSREPPAVRFDLGSFQPNVPIFFVHDKELFIDRNSLDHGWWRFYFAEAMPKTEIIFSPAYNSPETWDTLENTVRLLPNSAGFEPKITYSLCSGNDVFRMCESAACESDEFLDFYTSYKSSIFITCTATFSGNYRLVTISNNCANTGEVCVNPVEKNIYIDTKTLPYADYLDIVSVIIGAQNTISGEDLYNYKQKVFQAEAKLAAKIMYERALSHVQNPAVSDECKNAYSTQASILLRISTQPTQNLLEQSKLNYYQELINNGCDYLL